MTKRTAIVAGTVLVQAMIMSMAVLTHLQTSRLAETPYPMVGADLTDTFYWHALLAAALFATTLGGAFLLLRQDRLLSAAREADSRRELLARVRDRDKLLRAVIDGTPECVFLKDLDLRYVVVNEAAAASVGRRPEEVVGRRAGDFLPAAAAAESEAGDRRVIATGRTETAETVYEKDGRNFAIEALKSPHRDADGRVIGVIVIARDTTHRRLADAERRELEERLVQAQKMESIGLLAGGIAHDFNNLMTAILGNAELGLASLPEGDPVRSRLLQIERAVHRAAGLTRQLLAFGRRQPIAKKSVALNRVVGDLVELLQRTLGEDVRLETALEPNLTTVLADPAQLGQVLMNLAVNARDAMPSGGRILVSTRNVAFGELDVQVHTWARSGRWVVLSVADTGLGMSDETKRRLFEPFYTTKGQGQGTGLGLSVVHGIAAQHDGFLRVESEEGRGATIEIYLPCHGEDAEISSLTVLPRAAGGDETILVAEDEDAIRDLAAEVLRGLGYRVLVARDGMDAVAVFSAHKDEIRLAVLDLVMPGCGGDEAFRRMREERPELSALFVSGYSASNLAQEVVREPGTAFLHKPYAVDALTRAVRDLLDA